MKPFNFAETKMVERNFYRRYINVRLHRIIVLTAATALVSLSSVGLRTVYAKRVVSAKSELAQTDSFCMSARQELAVATKSATEGRWRVDLDKSSKGVLSTANAVMRCAPDDVWLSRVQCLDKGPDVMVEGCASTFASLSRMIGSLRVDRRFATVQLNGTQTMGPNAAEPVQFALLLKIKHRGASVPGTQGTQGPIGVPQRGGSN